MKKIEVLYGGAMEEITSAKEYSALASRYKNDEEELYKFFIGLAGTELEHAKGFITHLRRVVNDMPDKDWRFSALIEMLMGSLDKQLAEAKAAFDMAK